jgi:serine protease AprX
MLLFLRSFSSLALVTLILLCCALPAEAQVTGLTGDTRETSPSLVAPRESPVIPPRLQRFLSEHSPEESVKVWVFFTDKGILSEEQYQQARDLFGNSLSGAALKRRLKNKAEIDFLDLPVNQVYVDAVLKQGAVLRQRSRWLNAISVKIQVGKIENVARLPFVRRMEKVISFKRTPPRIEPPIGKLREDKNLAGYGRNYGYSLQQLDQINVPIVHDMGFAGENVIVGMLDTGYRKDHQAFAAAYSEFRVVAEYDFIYGDTNTQNEPADTAIQHNHGTYTWSALGGEYDGELYGPAYKATFVLAKTENTRGEEPIEEDNWVAGLEWADSIGAEVISSSLGYTDWYTYENLDGNTAICTRAADLAASRGIVVVNAAGNERIEPWHYIITPADGDSVIAVGAVDWTGEIASFSSVGPTYDGRIKPEVVARGVETYCALASDIDAYGGVGGTSLSAPLVGGCAAVLLSVHPDWTAVQVREALMMTANNAFSPDTVYGWGLVNLFAALNYNPSGALTIQHDPPLFTADTLNPYTLTATITPGNGLLEDSLFLYWRSDTLSAFARQSLQPVGADQYEAQIPEQDPQTVVHYYFSAQDSLYNVVNLPLGAARFKFKLCVATDVITFDFEDGLHDWESGGTNNTWNITSVDAYQGTFSLNDSPQGGYKNNTDRWVAVKKAFDLSDTDISSYRGTADLWRSIPTAGKGGRESGLRLPIPCMNGRRLTCLWTPTPDKPV